MKSPALKQICYSSFGLFFHVAGKILIAILVAVVLLSLLLFFYRFAPPHIDNVNGDTDYVWLPNYFHSKMTEGVAFGRYDAQGFNNISVVDNPDVLVLGSSHMEATEVMPNQTMSYLLSQLLKGRYSVYNKGISGHNLYKICQYLPRNLEMYERHPKIVILEISGVSVSYQGIREIFNKNVKRVKSHGLGTIGMMQLVPVFRLLYLQISNGLLNLFFFKRENGFAEKNASQSRNVDEKPYHQLCTYLQSMENKYGSQIIIVYHPTGELRKDGTILFKPSEEKDLFKKTAEDNGITFVDMADDFEKMYYESHHVAHGFVTGKLEYGHLNKYGHEAMAKTLYRTILNMEKDGEICK